MTTMEQAADALRRHEMPNITRDWERLDRATKNCWLDEAEVVISTFQAALAVRTAHERQAEVVARMRRA